MFDFEHLKINGIKVNYYFICVRKLWLFSKGIACEHDSDKVYLGKLLHEESYSRHKKRGITLDNMINIDIINGNLLNEVKYSDKMEEADIIQIKYYLYYLKQMGIEKKGILSYPRQKKKEIITLSKEDEAIIEHILPLINNITLKDKPPEKIKNKYCTKCAYYGFCYG
jgi:CRISPR-associated exonuclease Cas4